MEGVDALGNSNEKPVDSNNRPEKYFYYMITYNTNFNYYSNRQLKQTEKVRDIVNAFG